MVLFHLWRGRATLLDTLTEFLLTATKLRSGLMQSAEHPTDPLASIERHLVDLEYTIERQSIAIARLQDELADANRRADWYDVQFSEMMRILARDMRELRATLICS